MPTSVSRRGRRQFFGASKKGRTTRWIGCVTVEVIIESAPIRRRVTGPKGPGRVARRKRGQRRGVKRRSRGCHPRRTVPPPAPVARNVDSQRGVYPSSRSIRNHCRGFDYYEKRKDWLITFLFPRMKDVGDSYYCNTRDLHDNLLVCFQAWTSVHVQIKRGVSTDLADFLVGDSFQFFLEKHFRVFAVKCESLYTRKCRSARAVLLGWKATITQRHALAQRKLGKTSMNGKRPVHVLPKGKVICVRCDKILNGFGPGQNKVPSHPCARKK